MQIPNNLANIVVRSLKAYFVYPKQNLVAELVEFVISCFSS